MKKFSAVVFDAVVFDLDGTLLDTLEDLGDAVNRVLVDRGFPVHPMDAYKYFVGDGSAILIERALPESVMGSDVYRDCLSAFMADYDQSWKIKTRLYDGISEMLDSLTALGINMAILSNKSHGFTVNCVQDMLSKWQFKAVFGLRDDVPRKPDPAGALEISSLLGVSPDRMLYLGDTAIDMQTAVSAGMFPVGALWGFRTREELLENGARALIQHPGELLSLM
ncbi:MAG: HAD family hydrolase [Deltaproteobacteria bacterium]